MGYHLLDGDVRLKAERLRKFIDKHKKLPTNDKHKKLDDLIFRFLSIAIPLFIAGGLYFGRKFLKNYISVIAERGEQAKAISAAGISMIILGCISLILWLITLAIYFLSGAGEPILPFALHFPFPIIFPGGPPGAICSVIFGVGLLRNNEGIRKAYILLQQISALLWIPLAAFLLFLAVFLSGLGPIGGLWQMKMFWLGALARVIVTLPYISFFLDPKIKSYFK